MQWLERYITITEKVLQYYDGKLPLQHYLTHYFSRNKKHGSKDRRVITHLCYTYFRLGKALPSLAFSERLKVALFLCEHDLAQWKTLYTEEVYGLHHADLRERIELMSNSYSGFSLQGVFPMPAHLGSIDHVAFIASLFEQPFTYLRVRPGKKVKVTERLRNAELAFRFTGEHIIALAPATKLQQVLSINEDAVIQDESSQKVAAYFDLMDKNNVHTIYDCCAASGGKTMLAYDHFPGATIIATDIRSSIIRNLLQRLGQAGIAIQRAKVMDVTREKFANEKFDLILCDAPCSGSGTWGRTPEQLSFFNEKQLSHYVQLQRAIISNVAGSLAGKGYFLYITCSVFKEENEEQVQYILNNFPALLCLQAAYIEGYYNKADTMYAALFQLR